MAEDRPALEIEITPQMVAAGVKAMYAFPLLLSGDSHADDDEVIRTILAAALSVSVAIM